MSSTLAQWRNRHEAFKAARDAAVPDARDPVEKRDVGKNLGARLRLAPSVQQPSIAAIRKLKNGKSNISQWLLGGGGPYAAMRRVMAAKGNAAASSAVFVRLLQRKRPAIRRAIPSPNNAAAFIMSAEPGRGDLSTPGAFDNETSSQFPNRA
jgi:hypothetical protein